MSKGDALAAAAQDAERAQRCRAGFDPHVLVQPACIHCGVPAEVIRRNGYQYVEVADRDAAGRAIVSRDDRRDLQRRLQVEMTRVEELERQIARQAENVGAFRRAAEAAEARQQELQTTVAEQAARLREFRREVGR